MFATSNTASYEQTQTLALTASAGPTMVSAVYTTAPAVVLTYNEDVTCPTADAGTLFTYTWTGVATDAVTGCTAGAPGSDTLSLAVSARPSNDWCQRHLHRSYGGQHRYDRGVRNRDRLPVRGNSDAHHLDDAGHYGGGRHGGC